jgi:signal transduction histidine kinase/CheY-like chemotaxis protein
MIPKKIPSSRDILDLRTRLAELEATLGAIRSGEVDALIVNGPNGDQVYSLKGAEQPYRAFIERMGEGAVTLDTRGTILYCNQRFADMLEIPLQRVISTNFLKYLSKEGRPLLASMLSDSAPAAANFTLTSKKRKHLPVRIAVCILEDVAEGTHCAVVTDVTEQQERKVLKNALEKLQVSQAELQAQFEEVQAIRSKLEEANAAKDEFLAALSHELRTPLTPVLLTASAIAVDSSVPPALRADIETIRRNVELEARLIDDLLDITRIARGKLKIVPQVTDIHETIARAIDICEADTTAKPLRFSARCRAPHHFVNADAVRLQQIFWNLFRNAVKFTPDGGKVTVTTKNIGLNSKKPASIVITVRDTGIGIAKKDLHRIFNAFEQASGEITRRFGGLGLGLTISKRLVELHGGTIAVASPGAGKGTLFSVTLPTIAAPALTAAAPAPGITARSVSLRILLVEDHEDTRRNMTRLLSALKHSVTPAHDAASALKQAAKSTFDLVISDIGLPDESGLELMKKLKARHKLRGICLSGYGMDEDIARSREAGFLEHLTKPINFERLEAAIASAANGKVLAEH